MRERPGLKLVSLINLTASDGCWNTPQRRPAPVRGIRLKMAVLQEPEQVYAFSPDVDEGMPVTLKYTLEKRENGLFLCAKLPTLFNWACIAAEFAVDAIGQGK